MILNKDPAQARAGADPASEQDNSPENWKKVAAEFSTDATSKDKGGVRDRRSPRAVFAEPLDTEIFDAAEGEVEGPVETAAGTYVFQVDKITAGDHAPPSTTPRTRSSSSSSEPGPAGAFAAFLADYRDRWIELTICADDYLIERCDNFDGATPRPAPIRACPRSSSNSSSSSRAARRPCSRPRPRPRARFLPFTARDRRPAAAAAPAR